MKACSGTVMWVTTQITPTRPEVRWASSAASAIDTWRGVLTSIPRLCAGSSRSSVGFCRNACWGLAGVWGGLAVVWPREDVCVLCRIETFLLGSVWLWPKSTSSEVMGIEQRVLGNGPIETQRLRRRRYLESDLWVLLRGHSKNSQKPVERKNSFKDLLNQ